jgi:hypothetical protein
MTEEGPFLAYLSGTFKVEVYHHDIPGVGRITWDIGRAKRQLDAGHIVQPAPAPIDPAVMQHIADHNEYDDAVVASANPKEWGIAAPILWQGAIQYVLIDGTHRCIKALREGKPFYAYLLTDEAARACLLAAPEGVVP